MKKKLSGILIPLLLVFGLLVAFTPQVQAQETREPWFALTLRNGDVGSYGYFFRYYDYEYENTTFNPSESPLTNPFFITNDTFTVNVTYPETWELLGFDICNDTVRISLGGLANIYFDGVFVNHTSSYMVPNNFTIGWHTITASSENFSLFFEFYQEVDYSISKPLPDPVYITIAVEFYSSQDNFGIPTEAFKFWLNGERILDLTNITVIIGDTYNLTVTDFADNILKQWMYTIPADQSPLVSIGVNIPSPMGMAIASAGVGGIATGAGVLTIFGVQKLRKRKEE